MRWRRGHPAAGSARWMAPEDEEMVVAAVDHLAKRIEDIAARLERA